MGVSETPSPSPAHLARPGHQGNTGHLGPVQSQLLRLNAEEVQYELWLQLSSPGQTSDWSSRAGHPQKEVGCGAVRVGQGPANAYPMAGRCGVTDKAAGRAARVSDQETHRQILHVQSRHFQETITEITLWTPEQDAFGNS